MTTNEPSKEAKELARNLYRRAEGFYSFDTYFEEWETQIQSALDAAREAGRNEGLEEAKRVLEGEMTPAFSGIDIGICSIVLFEMKQKVKAIDTLKSTNKGEG